MTDVITYMAGSLVALIGAVGIYGDVTNLQEIDASETAMHVGQTWFGSGMVYCGQKDMNIISAVPETIKNMVSLPYNLITGTRYE